MSASFTVKSHVEPIFKTVIVNASPVRGFEVFTEGMIRWWNPNHSINPTKSPMARVVVEPRVGGRWYERGNDGSECEWGKVVVWQPPTRLVLDWQISAQWQFDATLLTEVDVRFKRTERNGQKSTWNTVILAHMVKGPLSCARRFSEAGSVC